MNAVKPLDSFCIWEGQKTPYPQQRSPGVTLIYLLALEKLVPPIPQRKGLYELCWDELRYLTLLNGLCSFGRPQQAGTDG